MNISLSYHLVGLMAPRLPQGEPALALDPWPVPPTTPARSPLRLMPPSAPTPPVGGGWWKWAGKAGGALLRKLGWVGAAITAYEVLRDAPETVQAIGETIGEAIASLDKPYRHPYDTCGGRKGRDRGADIDPWVARPFAPLPWVGAPSRAPLHRPLAPLTPAELGVLHVYLSNVVADTELAADLPEVIDEGADPKRSERNGGATVVADTLIDGSAPPPSPVNARPAKPAFLPVASAGSSPGGSRSAASATSSESDPDPTPGAAEDVEPSTPMSATRVAPWHPYSTLHPLTVRQQRFQAAQGASLYPVQTPRDVTDVVPEGEGGVKVVAVRPAGERDIAVFVLGGGDHLGAIADGDVIVAAGRIRRFEGAIDGRARLTVDGSSDLMPTDDKGLRFNSDAVARFLEVTRGISVDGDAGLLKLITHLQRTMGDAFEIEKHVPPPAVEAAPPPVVAPPKVAAEPVAAEPVFAGLAAFIPAPAPLMLASVALTAWQTVRTAWQKLKGSWTPTTEDLDAKKGAEPKSRLGAKAKLVRHRSPLTEELRPPPSDNVGYARWLNDVLAPFDGTKPPQSRK